MSPVPAVEPQPGILYASHRLVKYFVVNRCDSAFTSSLTLQQLKVPHESLVRAQMEIETSPPPDKPGLKRLPDTTSNHRQLLPSRHIGGRTISSVVVRTAPVPLTQPEPQQPRP